MRSTFLGLVACISGITRASKRLQDSQTVGTTTGTFAPYYPQEYPNLVIYSDIPYGENPVGELRFAPPVPACPAPGVVTATSYPPGCFQLTQQYLQSTVDVVVESAFLYQGGNYNDTAEDCLRLAIFAPKTAVPRGCSSGKLPVLVWIHGGGLDMGGINVPYQLAPNWVERSQAHIVVQIGYRLNMLGFPNAAALIEEGQNLNFGLLDQRLALEWVRDNIEAFGGDPTRIALWGESAGALSVDYYNYAYPDDPIVYAMMLDSGNALYGSTTMSPLSSSNFTYAASQLGCGDLSPEDELNCMRNVPSSEIKEFLQGPAGVASLTFPTAIDNVTFFANYTERTLDGKFSKVPQILGTNENEGNCFIPYVNGPTLPAIEVELAEVITEGILCSATKITSLRHQVGVQSYRYYYSGNFTNLSPQPWLGSYHTSELPLFFGTYDVQYPNSTLFEQNLSEYMQDMYLSFIQDPYNGLQAKGWPVATPTGPIFQFGADNTLSQLMDINTILQQCTATNLYY